MSPHARWKRRLGRSLCHKVAMLVLMSCLVVMEAPGAMGQTLPDDADPSRRSTFPGGDLFNDQPPFLTGVRVNHSDGIYRAGDLLEIQFQSEVEAHLYLLYHQADGSSLLLFPNKLQPESRVAAGRPIKIPSDGASLRFRIRPPLGREVLQVVAAMQPVAELESVAAQPGSPDVAAELLATITRRLMMDRTQWTEHRVALTTLEAEAAADFASARLGLFIGIGRYQRPEIAATHDELRHSAEVMYQLMLRHGNLDPARTRLVRDAEATRANLQSLVTEWLPQVSRPGDTVFIYFSGHAGQLPTNDPREPDGLDEALGPYDLEAGRDGESREQALARLRSTNITDDALAAWLSRLSGRQVILILDTCFSGGVIEGKTLSKSFWVDESSRVKDISQVNTLVVSSCAADEQSLFEGTSNGTMWFTFCLTEAMQRSAGQQPLSVQQAFEQARGRMRELIDAGNAPREQEPTMTDRVRLPVLLVR